MFFCGVLVLCALLSTVRRFETVEKLSVREIIIKTIERKIHLIAAYINMFIPFAGV